MSAWGVTSGSYSDYTVLCICPSKADAEAVAVKLRSEAHGWHRDATTQEFGTADASTEPVSVLYLTTEIFDDGTERPGRDDAENRWPFEDYWVKSQWRWVRAPIHRGKGGRLEVQGTDHERVRKVFSDTRAQLIADHAFRASKERKGRVA